LLTVYFNAGVDLTNDINVMCLVMCLFKCLK